MARVEMYGLDANRQPVRTVANSPVGWIGWYPVESPPVGTLVCNGGAVSRTAYAELFAVLGTKYGAGDGSTTFNLPDLRGRFVRGTGGNAEALGVAQGDAIRNIEGTAMIDPFIVSAAEIRETTGAFYKLKQTAIFKAEMRETAYGESILRFNAGAVVPTANENRPVNIALLPCIIYE